MGQFAAIARIGEIRMKIDYFKQFAVVFMVFLFIDAVWLGLIAPRFYQSQIGFLLRERPNWWAAGTFYPLYVAGITILIVSPSVREQDLGRSARTGAILGLVSYGTYDLTNLATVEGWPIVVTVVDLVWGTVLTGSVAFVSTWTILRWGAQSTDDSK